MKKLGRWESFGRSVASSALLTMAAMPAGAQDAAAQGPGATLEEIVVTAERRETSLQATPISIVAFTQDAVEAKGIKDLYELSKFTPNLSIAPSRGTGDSIPNYAIRGISNGSAGTGGGAAATLERAVGMYIDGVYMPRVSGSVLKVIDIDRIEVLRGPQGTLFGRNSTAGAIRIFTKPPSTKDVEGYVRGTYGSWDRTDLVGAINIPMGEQFALRLQGGSLQQDGFVDRGTEELGASEDVVARGALSWAPTADANITLGYLYTDSKSNGAPFVFTQFDMSPGIPGFVQGNFGDWLNDAFVAAGQAPLAPYNDPRLVTGDPYRAHDICLLDDFDPDYDAACNQFSDNKYSQFDLTARIPLSDSVTFSSVTGYSELEHRGVSSFSQIGVEARRDDVDSTTFYQELQLNMELFGGAVDLVTGGNYFREKARAPNWIVDRRGTSRYPAAANGNADGGLFLINVTYTEQLSDSYGGFLSSTWHVTDSLNVTGGARYSVDEKDFSITRFATPTDTFIPAPGTTSTTVEDRSKSSYWDYRLTGDYHFTADAMAYATVSRAHKAGAYGFTPASSVPGPAQSELLNPTPPEQVQSYELGARITLFDRLRINPTVFFMEFTNRQALVQILCTGQPGCPPAGFNVVTRSAGDQDIQGAELELQFALTSNLTFDAGAAFADVDVLDPVANGGPHPYPDSPSPTFNVGGTYDGNFSFGNVTFNMNYAYAGPQDTHFSNNPDSEYELGGYGIVNSRIRWTPVQLPLTVTLFANNLFDKEYAVYGQRFGGAFWDQGGPPPTTGAGVPPRSAVSHVMGRPLEVGLTLEYKF